MHLCLIEFHIIAIFMLIIFMHIMCTSHVILLFTEVRIVDRGSVYVWKVHAGFMCIVNSFIFRSSFFGFFSAPFLHKAITDIIIVLRDTRSEE